MKNFIIAILRYLIKLGFKDGIYLFIKLHFSKHKLIKVKHKGYDIQLRAKTSDTIVFDQVFISKQYEFKFSFDPKIIIDGGANIGMSAIYFHNQFPEARIICIEPSKENFKVLQQNTCKLSNIEILEGGLWYKDAKLKPSFLFGNEDFAFTVAETNDNTLQSVNAFSINTLMNLYHIDEIDILKVDIEGSELELFSDNYTYWIPKCKCIIIELHDRFRKGTGTSFYKAISQFDFSYFYHKENIICIRN